MDPYLPAHSMDPPMEPPRQAHPEGSDTLSEDAFWGVAEQVWIFRMIGQSRVVEAGDVPGQESQVRLITQGELYGLDGVGQGDFTELLQPGKITGNGFQAEPWDLGALRQAAPEPGLPMDQPEGIHPAPPTGQVAVHFKIGDGSLTWVGTVRAMVADQEPSTLLYTSGSGLLSGGEGTLQGLGGVATLVAVRDLGPHQDLEPGDECRTEMLCSLRVTPPPGASQLASSSQAAVELPELPGLIVGYGIETGEVASSGSETYLVARGDMMSLDARPMGSYVGAMPLAGPLNLQALAASSEATTDPEDSLRSAGNFKIRFQMTDGAVDLVGSGYAHVTPVGEDHLLMAITANGLITGGTDRYQGARGVGSIQGTTYLPRSTQLTPGSRLPFKTLFQLLPVPGHDLATEVRHHPPAHHPAHNTEPENAWNNRSGAEKAWDTGTWEKAPHAPSWSEKNDGITTPQRTGSSEPVHPMTQPDSNSIDALLKHLPPGVDPVTFDLEVVDQMMDRIAAFLLYGRQRAEPIGERGHIVGFRLTVPLGRLDAGDRPPTPAGMTAENLVSADKPARLRLELRFVPDDYVAHYRQMPPPTPFEPERNQRFVVVDGEVRFHDRLASRVELFGTGQTFPTIDPGPPLSLGLALAMFSGTGAFNGLPGMVAVNVLLEPSWTVDAAVLIRAADPDGRLILPSPPPLPEPQPVHRSGSTFFMLRGNNDVQDPTELIVTPDGRMTGAHLRQQISLARLGFDLCEPQGLCSGASYSPIVCRLKARMQFNPIVDPPVPFTIKRSTFSFFDDAGQMVGELHANIVEGRGFPTPLPGLRLPLQRGAALAPIIGGSGIFEGVRGLVTVINWISIFPRQVSALFLFRLLDPNGRFRATTHPLGCSDCDDGMGFPTWTPNRW